MIAAPWAAADFGPIAVEASVHIPNNHTPYFDAPRSTGTITVVEGKVLSAPPLAPNVVPSMRLSTTGAVLGLVGIFGLVALGYFLPCSVAALILGMIGKRQNGPASHNLWMFAIVSGSVGVGLTLMGLAMAYPLFL